MAGGLGKTMLGFADEVWEGMSKGVGDAAAKKVGGTLLKSNMSKQQKAALRNLRRGVGDTGQAASRAVAHSKTVFANTKNFAVNTLQQALDRCGGELGNKGVEGAITAIKMANI